MQELTVPIFPLPVVVLFPHGRAPLHIFELRYRQMIEDVLSGKGVLGMVALSDGNFRGTEIDPAVYSIGCLGRVSHHQRLPDGRFNLVVDADQRFRILDEVEQSGKQLYRTAHVSCLTEPIIGSSEGVELSQQRAEIMHLLETLIGLSSSEKPRLDTGLLEEKDDSSFVNNVCQAITLPTPEKQGLLEAENVLDRATRLLVHLRFYQASVRSGGTGGSLH